MRVSALSAATRLTRRRQREGRIELAALCVTIALGGVSIYILPVLAGAIVDGFAVSESFVGYIMAVQLAGIAVPSLLLSPIIHRVSYRTCAIGAIAAIVLGNAISTQADAIWLLVVARGIVGFGEGTLLTLVNGIAARTERPLRTFTILIVTKAAFAIVVFLALPYVVGTYGARGTFGMVAVAAVFLAPITLFLPRRSDALADDTTAPVGVRTPWSIDGTLVLLAWLLFQIGQNGLWTYVERIAVRIGLGIDVVTNVMIVVSATGVIAPMIAGLLGRRIGLLIPIVSATMLSAAGSLWFVHAQAAWDYAAAGILMTVALFFAYPYMASLAAGLDPKGRLAAALPGAHAIGSAIGPAVAAAILGQTGTYLAVGWFAAAATLVCAFVVIRPALRLDRAARDA